MTTRAELSALGFSDDEGQFLEEIVRGGRSGDLGKRYEDWYATFRLLLGAQSLLEGHGDQSVETQAECFVNDVVVRLPTRLDYCQAKTSLDVTWTGDGAKLLRQFRLQKRLCETTTEKFRIRVITPHPRRRELLKKRLPADLSSCVTVTLFPTTMPWEWGHPAAPVLKAICADPRTQSSPSHLEALAKAFHGYLFNQKPGTACLASAATDYVRALKLKTPLIRADAAPTPASWPQAEALLHKVPGLAIDIDRGVFRWRCGPEAGTFPESCDSVAFAKFLARIVKNPPASFEDFDRELPT